MSVVISSVSTRPRIRILWWQYGPLKGFRQFRFWESGVQVRADADLPPLVLGAYADYVVAWKGI